jgi:hypothetical protein
MDEASATTPQEQDVQAIKQRPSADRFGCCCPFRTFPNASGGEGNRRRRHFAFWENPAVAAWVRSAHGMAAWLAFLITFSSLEPWNFRFIDGSGGRAKLGFVSRLLGTFLTSQKNELRDGMSV